MIIPQSRFESNGLTVIIHDIDTQYVYYEKRRTALSGTEWGATEQEAWPLFRMPIAEFVKAACGREWSETP